MSDSNDDSISRFHVRINGKRTTISIDPDLFRALCIKLDGAAYAREWVNITASDLVKVNKSISRQIQSKIARILAGSLPLPEIKLPEVTVGSVKPAKVKKVEQSFKSDELPL